MRKYIMGAWALLSLVPSAIYAQSGVSSSSYSVARAGSQMTEGGVFRMPSPDKFLIEEFVNYHRHDLPLPESGKRVRLDLQHATLEDGKTIVQVGIATPRAMDSSQMPPLNVVLVIDRSGSMGGDRIAKVRQAIRAFAEHFRETDKLSIVGFGGMAKIDLAANGKTHFADIMRCIEGLEANYGGTNLHAGLMLGYETALEHFDSKRTNRVIFLTDGNANIGVTEAEEIAKQSAACKAKDISLMTIGLGVDFNHGMLRQISDAKLGPMHYVADAADIQKIFVDEVDSLLAPAAKEVTLEMNFGSSKAQLFGYDVEKNDGQYRLELDDLNHGATQVVMARVKGELDLDNLRVTLRYVDAISGQSCQEQVACDQDSSETASDSIAENYSIALIAKALKSAAALSQEDQPAAAAKRLQKGLDQANRVYKMLDRGELEQRENVAKIAKIAGDYQKSLLESCK